MTTEHNAATAAAAAAGLIAVGYRPDHDASSTQRHTRISANLSHHSSELGTQQSTVFPKPNHYALELASRHSNTSASGSGDSNHRSRTPSQEQRKLDATHDFVAGHHGYSIVAAGGRVGAPRGRRTEIDEVLRAVDGVVRELAVDGGITVAKGKEERDGKSIRSRSEREKGSMPIDLSHVGAWDSYRLSTKYQG